MTVKSTLARVLVPLIEMGNSDFNVTDCAFSKGNYFGLTCILTL